MYMLHLFDSCEAVQPIDARLLRDGTILIAGTQSILADAILLWGFSYEVI